MSLIDDIKISSLSEATEILKGEISYEDLFEKAKKVGDEKVYQGVTYYVHALNSKGQPLWRKKKDGGSSAPTSTKTPSQSSGNAAKKSKWKVGDTKQYQGVTWVCSGFNDKGGVKWRKAKDQSTSTNNSTKNTTASNTSTQQTKSDKPIAKTTYKQFAATFKLADDETLNKIISGKIQSTDQEKGFAKRLLDERKNKVNTTQTVVKGKKIPTTLDEAKKIGEADKDAAKGVRVNLAYAKDDIDAAELDVSYYEDRLKDAIKNNKDYDTIKGCADRYASSKSFFDSLKKAVSERRKQRKKFIDNSGHDFSLDEIKEYLNFYNTAKEGAAVISSKWGYFKGSIGSTECTLSIGSGKPKRYRDATIPSWRPIGIISFSERNYNGTYDTIEIPVQSWNDVNNAFKNNPTSSFSASLYKHPVK